MTTKKTYVLAVVGALIIGLAAAGSATADPSERNSQQALPALGEAVAHQELAPGVLANASEEGQADGFVIFAEAEGEETLEALAERKREVLAKLGDEVEVIEDYQALRVSLVRVRSPEALEALLDDPQVVGVGENRRNEAFLAESLPLIRQPQVASRGLKGAGTSVAVIDTGVDFTRAAFGNCTAPSYPASCRVPFSWDFAPNDAQLDDPQTGLHGTNVAGIAAGVAPETKILALDVFDGGGAWDRDIIAAINWVTLNQATYNIRAMNLSLGYRGSYYNAECAAANQYVPVLADARAHGILPVFAAGNSAFVNGVFTEGVANPACTPGAIRVGAVYDANVGARSYDVNFDGIVDCTDATTAPDQIVCFSQTGPLLTVLAPGSVITAAGVTMSGTSMAAPHVAGAAAVVAAHKPSAPLADIEAALTSGPTITDPRNNLARPRLDLYSAFRTPPVLTHPSNIYRVTRSAAGTRVYFTASATDLLDPNPAVICTPSSGSIFPIGQTTVSCTATDSDGDTATGTFDVFVEWDSICDRFPWKCEEEPKRR